jgi:predicted RNA-binding protein with PUA-like domain
MNYWIGVIGSKLSYERLQAKPYWFCLPQSSVVGDKILMYAAKSAAGVNGGIFAIFEIINKDESKDGQCRNYGIMSGTGERPVYVDLALIILLSKNLPFQLLKATPALRNSTFIKRQFQATYFKISAAEFSAIKSLI